MERLDDKSIEASIVKLFVGGISRKTSQNSIFKFFQSFDGFQDFELVRDKNGRSRGYGFIWIYGYDISNRLINSDSIMLSNQKLEFKPIDEEKINRSMLIT
jgi:RNA recognition motif-containing protein